ncbi:MULTISPECIES: arginine--tRNA ligase [Kitasatospora]|uniref:Putative arginyl-tRNA synthetase n=1 Tax=Kitasatospora setae (strain ATCC 33774 / DSM 43861 / JCM 3304 / KCC A-0304 / NBRC 14216 / KM-6054) TaxID=452652 RepID=E4ND70_KITSK|nr:MULTISPECIES: arginine--tRNA ligase [Kitasatospora]BAJ29151.1 putative arginyl-tRNA synthetase [Kitasatospora setae KM-6054]
MRDRDHSLPVNPLLRELLGDHADPAHAVHWNRDGRLHYRDRTGAPRQAPLPWHELGEYARSFQHTYWKEWSTHLRGRRVIVEHTSINPVHPMHLGALRSTLIGGSLARLLRSAGAEVRVHYFVNDHGRQVVLLDWIMARTRTRAIPPGMRFDTAAGVLYALVNMVLGERAADIERLTAAHPWLDRAVPPELRDPVALRARLADPTDPRPGFVDRMVDLAVADMGLVHAEVDHFERESAVTGPLDSLLHELLAEHPAVAVNGTWCLRRPDGLVPVARANGSSLYFLRDVANSLARDPAADLMLHVIGDDQTLLQRALRDVLAARGRTSEHVAFGTIHDRGRKFSSRQNRLITVAEVDREDADRLASTALEMMLRRPRRALDVGALTGRPHRRVAEALELASHGTGVGPEAGLPHPAARELATALLRSLGAAHGALHLRSPHPLARYLVDLATAYRRAARAGAVPPWAREWFLHTHEQVSGLLGLRADRSHDTAGSVRAA